MIEFHVPWRVEGKGNKRPIWRAKDGAPRIGVQKSVKANADALILLASQYRPPEPWDCATRVCIEVTYSWLTMHDKIRKAGKSRIPKITAPDCDQLQKQVHDVLESAGFVTNDARFYETNCSKWHGDEPGLSVTLEKVE